MRKLLKLLVIPFIIAISLCIIFALQADRRVADRMSMIIKEYEDIDNSHHNKIPVGAYHFMTTSSSAENQFEHFKRVVPKDKIIYFAHHWD